MQHPPSERAGPAAPPRPIRRHLTAGISPHVSYKADSYGPGSHTGPVTRRVNAKQQDGERGEHAVQAAIEDLGWSWPVKIPRDLGDDLITFATARVPKVAADRKSNDETEDFDLSAPVLIQVKSSKSKYSRPTKRDNGRVGWWFYEDSDDHFDHWLRFGLPYLLVFHDLSSKTSYWAHVHRDNIEPTDNGRRLFVPAQQRIDEPSREALTTVAVSERAAVFAEAWTIGSRLTPAQKLRHALIAPRSIAPPASAMPNKLTYEEAVALLLLDRQSDVADAIQTGACPDQELWLRHKAWGWRFAQAILELLTSNSETTTFARLAKTAPTKYERDACQIVRGCAALIEQRHRAAITRFQPDRYSKPVDRAWLHAQRAHSLLERNNRPGAAEAAEEALACIQAEHADLTVASIRAAATSTLYGAIDWEVGVEPEAQANARAEEHASEERPDRSKVVRLRLAALQAAQQGPPNLGSLWRTESVSSALGTDLDNRFNAWAGNQVIYFGGRRKTGFTELNAAAASAAFAGSWQSWRQLTGQAARIMLATSVDADECDAALRALTRAGLTKETRLSAKRLWLNGPIAGLQANVTAIAEQPWSLRSEGPALGILAEAADLLDTSAADAAIVRILNILRTKGALRRIGGGWTDRWSEADSALARLLFAAGPRGHEECAEVIIQAFNGDGTRVHEATRIGGKVRPKLLSPDTQNRLVEALKNGESMYRAELLERYAEDVPQARAVLGQLAADGDKPAARSLVVIGETESDNWATLGKNSAPVVAKLVKDAKGDGRSRKLVKTPLPSLYDLTLSAFHTGNTRHWKVVTDALAAGVLPGEQMDGAVQFLATHFDELPQSVQLRVKRLVPKLRAEKEVMFDSTSFDAAVFALQLAASTLDDGAKLAKLLQTKHMSGVEFARLVANVPTVERTAFVLACTVDIDPHIRAQAAYGVVKLASQETHRASDLETALRKSLELSDGCRMPLGAATALKEFKPAGFQKVQTELQSHPSAVVRNMLA